MSQADLFTTVILCPPTFLLRRELKYGAAVICTRNVGLFGGVFPYRQRSPRPPDSRRPNRGCAGTTPLLSTDPRSNGST
jgi:hypothetical protein